MLTVLVTIRSINGGAGYNSVLARASPTARATADYNVEPKFLSVEVEVVSRWSAEICSSKNKMTSALSKMVP